MLVRRSAAIAIVFVTLVTGASAQWPEFRGPGAQGHADAARLPLEWSESSSVAWKVPVPGSGWSSPVVGDGKIWLTSAVAERGGTSLRALAFSLATGALVTNVEVFRTPRARALNPKNSLASPTPILADGRVYVHFGADGTAALTSDGQIAWKARFAYDSQHGNGGSPAIVGDLLIISCDGADDAFVVAIDRATGKTRWRRSRRQPFDQAYATPLVIRVDGRDQIVSPGAYRVAAYAPEDGREIWRVEYRDGFSNVPRPVFAHGLVYVATGFNQPALLAIRPTGSGDVTRSHVVWSLTRGAPLTPSPIVVGDGLYVVSDVGVATRLNALTGVITWQQRLGGNYSASPIFAAGRIYFQSEEGVTTVIAPGERFERLAVNRVDGATLASMAVADGAIILRSDEHLYRIEVLK